MLRKEAQAEPNPSSVPQEFRATLPYRQPLLMPMPLDADEIIMKAHVSPSLTPVKRMLISGPLLACDIESVAAVLERTTQSTIQAWFGLVETEEKLTSIPMSFELRCGHLPQLFCDLASRLRSSKPVGSTELVSAAAAKHGLDRHKQGYTLAMMVEESRMLEVSIFHMLHENRASLDFSVLLVAVMTIADEIDSQLSQATASFSTESLG